MAVEVNSEITVEMTVSVEVAVSRCITAVLSRFAVDRVIRIVEYRNRPYNSELIVRKHVSVRQLKHGCTVKWMSRS